MENNNKIFSELNEISPYLTQVGNECVYSTPPSYFANVAEDVVEKIKAGVEPVYYFTNQNPFLIPVNYFEDFAAQVLRKIKGEKQANEVSIEMEEISPLLNTISKNPVYSVPPQYFEKVKWEKAERNKVENLDQKSKIISFTSSKKTFSYLVAAVIFGVLAVGIFLFTGKQKPGLSAGGPQAVSKVKALSEQEIVDFLKTTSPTENIVSTGITSIKDNDIKTSVSKMSDKEIKDFLQEFDEESEM